MTKIIIGTSLDELFEAIRTYKLEDIELALVDIYDFAIENEAIVIKSGTVSEDNYDNSIDISFMIQCDYKKAEPVFWKLTIH